MFKKVLALMLVLTIVFSLTACKSEGNEDEAVADELAESQTDTTPDNNSTNNTDNKENNSGNTNGTTDIVPDKTPDTSDEDNNTPPPSTDLSFTVTFDFGYDNKSETKKTDGKVTQPDISREGYTLDGWFNGSDKFDFSKEITTDITLTAKWTAITYNITYKADGSTLPTDNPTTYTTEETKKLKAPTMMARIFLGWSIDNGKETMTSESIPKGMTGDLILTPVWDENAIIFGKYEQDGNKDNGSEDIVWIKLKEENGKELYISKFILDAKQHDPVADYIKWAGCSLRKWLNDSFYKKSFTDEERKAIVRTEVKTPGVEDGSISNDYIYLLSIEEVKELMTSPMARKADLTNFAEANGAQNSPEGGWWWLRTKISYYGAALIENTGNIREIGYNAKMTTIGVRPVMWIDTTKLK